MIDHVSLQVSDLARARTFWSGALAPLGYAAVGEGDETSWGVGSSGGATVWLGAGRPQKPAVHVAFRAATRAEVDAFHAAALAAGGRDNGRPGLREHYGPTYYAAFALDPDGNNVEAVCLSA